MDGQTDGTNTHNVVSDMRAAESTAWVRRHHGASHMKGWECFGTTDEKEPTLRPLGVVSFPKRKGMVITPYADADEWPDGELTNGVAGVSITTYGDDPTGAFVAVSGTDPDQVRAAFDRTVAAWNDLRSAIWTEASS